MLHFDTENSEIATQILKISVEELEALAKTRRSEGKA